MQRRNVLSVAMPAAFAYALPMAAFAHADYPDKPIKIIVAFPPGGSSDMMARMVADALDPNLKYNAMTDFIHLTQVHSGPNVLVVHPDTPFKSVKHVVNASSIPLRLCTHESEPP